MRQSQEPVWRSASLFAGRRNIKFVSKNRRASETLTKTMTRVRVYAHVEGDDLKAIVYFDNENKRSKQVDIDHSHGGGVGANPTAAQAVLRGLLYFQKAGRRWADEEAAAHIKWLIAAEKTA